MKSSPKSSLAGLSVLATVLILGATPALAQNATAMNGPLQAQDAQQPVTPDVSVPLPASVDPGPETMGGTGTSATAGTGTDATLDLLPDPGADRSLLITQRTHPEYIAQGVRMGSFRFLPDVTLSELYNDNIYATHKDAKSDWINVIEPRLALRSDWHRHALNFLAADVEGLYDHKTSENYSDYLVQSDGRIDVSRNTKLAGLASYSQNHEERGDPNDQAQQTDPVVFKVQTLQAEASHQINRVKFDVIYTNQDFRYDNGQTKQGQLVDDSIRNRVDNEVTGRVSYELTPTEDVYVQSAYNNRDYNARSNRDSDGYNVFAGLRADVTGKLFGDIYAGYMAQNYDSSAYKDYSGVGFGLNGYWNPTTIDTLTLNLGRDVEETIVPGASNYIETRSRLNWDHELLRNVLLNAEAGYSRDSFEGIGRDDDVYLAGVGAKYLINSHFNLFANYDYIDRVSNISVDSYQQNRFLVGVKAAL